MHTINESKQTAEDRAAQEALRQRGPLPAHIAVIMDGNGRWARQLGHNRVFGHEHGTESVRDVTEAAAELGVPYLTLYTFSTENWQRPPGEVNALMELLIRTLRDETRTLMDNDVRLNAIGDLDMLPAVCRRELDEALALTKDNARMTLTLALSYSGRWEILSAVRQIARLAQEGTLRPEEIDETVFAAHLETAGMPDPDLLIRTGGDYRVSNFLLWQLAYTELFIAEQFWPEFRREHLYEAIADFQDRERRFGRVPV